MTGPRPLIGSLIFFFAAPGTVAGLIPYLISDWRWQSPFFGLSGVRAAGALLLVLGLLAVIECFWRFATEGRGTPAPVAPTETLIVTGLYRHVRNPMYVGVLSMITGQALLLGDTSLLVYAVVMWVLFTAFVLAYEEPVLARRYGPSYDAYRRNVGRWWPRATPWRGEPPGGSAQ